MRNVRHGRADGEKCRERSAPFLCTRFYTEEIPVYAEKSENGRFGGIFVGFLQKIFEIRQGGGNCTHVPGNGRVPLSVSTDMFTYPQKLST
jgi:hypothetical protein